MGRTRRETSLVNIRSSSNRYRCHDVSLETHRRALLEIIQRPEADGQVSIGPGASFRKSRRTLRDKRMITPPSSSDAGPERDESVRLVGDAAVMKPDDTTGSGIFAGARQSIYSSINFYFPGVVLLER